MDNLINDKDLEMIRRFFDYDLSEEELTRFDDRLNADQAFAMQVDKFQQVSASVDAFIFEKKIKPEGEQPIPNEAPAPQGASGSWMKLGLRLALGILLLAVAGYFVMKSIKTKPADTTEVYAQIEQYTDRMTQDILRGDDVSVPAEAPEADQLKGILADYDSGNKENAMTSLDKFIVDSKNPENKELAYWWKVRWHLDNGQQDEAIQALKTIKSTPGFNSSKKATQWLEKF